MNARLRLRDDVWVVGSSTLSDSLSHALDCHVYLVGTEEELVLVDAGCGLAPDALVANIRRAGHEPSRITRLLLTHGHGDHAGGARALVDRIEGLRVAAAPPTRGWVSEADERSLSLDVARDAGVYPADYRFPACPVVDELSPERPVQVGGVRLGVIETPGHCRGHVSLLAERHGRTDLFAGDAVFDGGRIALQPIHDCDLREQVATLRRLRALAVDGLFAGHGTPVLEHGSAHIERANRVLDRLQLPDPLIPPDDPQGTEPP